VVTGELLVAVCSFASCCGAAASVVPHPAIASTSTVAEAAVPSRASIRASTRQCLGL